MSVNTRDEDVLEFPTGIENGLKPRLVFLARMHNGDLVDATLSGKTKETLMGLARRGTSPLGGIAHPSSGQKFSQELQEECPKPTPQISTGLYTSKNQLDPNLVRIEVPLKNNIKFFQILQHGLSDLNTLHSQEKSTLRTEISDLGQAVSKVAHPARDLERTDLYAWRAIFSLYLDCNIFFSTAESEKFNRSPADVQQQLQAFSSRLEVLQETNRFRRKESGLALQHFLLINITLLRNLKFQHLNMRAAGKILKSG
ncbi:MAG: hypothetical protein Q9212_001875 [Teloschistes hypoglaucus]